MNTHTDIVNKRKCVHIYNNMVQTADNINEYRYGYAIESYNNINMAVSYTHLRAHET